MSRQEKERKKQGIKLKNETFPSKKFRDSFKKEKDYKEILLRLNKKIWKSYYERKQRTSI